MAVVCRAAFTRYTSAKEKDEGNCDIVPKAGRVCRIKSSFKIESLFPTHKKVKRRYDIRIS